MPRIMLIEENCAAQQAAWQALKDRGHEVVAVDAATAFEILAEQRFDVVVAGVGPVRDEDKNADAVSREHELVCLQQPWSTEQLVEAISEVEDRAAIRRLLDSAGDVATSKDDQPIVGDSPAIRQLLARVGAVAVSDAPVLLTGESGTGKELLARMIHARSSRRDKPLVTVNCAAFPETLIEAELFGHERGAFTGALHKRDGKFKAAEGGTLFLDEINGLSLAAQAKLLRVLQDGRFHPLGTNTEVAVDVRLISATNRPLSAMVAEGGFRGDLYYRVKVLDLELPALRHRSDDLPLLVAHFIAKHAPAGRRTSITPRAWAAFSSYAFPGNVRELEHAIQRAIVLARGSEIDLEHLPSEIAMNSDVDERTGGSGLQPLAMAVAAFEREYVRRALDAAGGNKTRAAQLLGISRKHLWEKLRRLERLDR